MNIMYLTTSKCINKKQLKVQRKNDQSAIAVGDSSVGNNRTIRQKEERIWFRITLLACLILNFVSKKQ